MAAWLSVVADITAIVALVLITTVSVGGAIYDVIDRKKWRKEMEEDFMRHFGISQDTENVEE